jgi:hypothetical protein
MKTSVFAAILLATAFNALADEDCSNPYANGGDVEIQEAAAGPMAQSKPFRHEYLNGGHFEAATEPVNSIDTAFPSRTAMLPSD